LAGALIKMNVLLGVTGSVAATLTKKMVEALQEAGYEPEVILTRSAEYFVPRKCLGVPVYDQNSEWPQECYAKDDEILHIKLRDWAEALVIAPLSANTLAKLAAGQADNLLTCVFLAWDKKKPIILAPAMNTKMWENPLVQRNLLVLVVNLSLAGYTVKVIEPIAKKLDCGEEGIGAMAEIADIIKAIKS